LHLIEKDLDAARSAESKKRDDETIILEE